jgi:hypothetical protein
MYTALNPRIASTVLGSAALIVVPVPFFLIKWGPTLRKKSRYAMDQPLSMHETHTRCTGADSQAPSEIEQGKACRRAEKGEIGKKTKATIDA